MEDLKANFDIVTVSRNEHEFDISEQDETAWSCLRLARMIKNLVNDQEVRYAIWRAAQHSYNGFYWCDIPIKAVLDRNGFHDGNKGELVVLYLPQVSIDIIQQAVLTFADIVPTRIVDREDERQRVIYLPNQTCVRFSHYCIALGEKGPFNGYLDTHFFAFDDNKQFEERFALVD